MRAIGHLHGADRPVHATGYCLGGTLMALVAATLGRQGGASTVGLPPLRSLAPIAAQTDFSEPGELGLFLHRWWSVERCSALQEKR